MKETFKFNFSGTTLILISLLIWGVAPIYFKSVQMVSSLEILAHRIIWSLFFLLFVIIIKKKLHKIIEIFYAPRILFTLTCTAILISCNWLLYIWAILNNHLLEATFGSFITPIFNILLGLIFLREKLNFFQIISLFITIIAIYLQFIEINFKGFTPFIPILLSGTFGFYALLRKQVKVESLHSLTVEALLLSPPAIIYLLYAGLNKQLLFFTSIKMSFLLIFSGIVTALPLILYFAGTKLLPLSKVGFLQYISPTIQLIIAIFIFHEYASFNKIMSFILVWSALVLYILNNIISVQKSKKISSHI